MLYIIPLTEIVLKAVVATVNTSLNHLHWSYLFECDAKKLAIISVITYVVDTISSVTGFHVAMCLFSNRSQMASECGENKQLAHAINQCATDVFKPLLMSSLS